MYTSFQALKRSLKRQRSHWTLIKASVALVLLASFSGTYLLATYPEDAAANSLVRVGSPAASTSATPASTTPALATSSSKRGNSLVPNCTPGSMTQPSPPELSQGKTGLQQVMLPNTLYTVYGTSTSQILTQMATCTPISADDGDRFAASTNYAINWSFRYQDRGDGSCAVTSASVGITIAETYPSWQPSAGTSTNLINSWQTFIRNLTTHEAGHVTLDQQAAATILSHLQSLPTTDCSAIVSTANTIANGDIAALDRANDAYDATTNHGAAQGAVLR